MPYFSPYIDAAGLHIPTFLDVRDELLQNAYQIFGADIYLEPDSQDYQFISVFARMIYDTFLAQELAYNSRSPVTAVGTALDSLVKLSGIARHRATQSTAVLCLTGTAGTVLTGRFALDSDNRTWDIPASVLIGPSGVAYVTAICRVPGPEVAEAKTISRIGNPTEGWISVINYDAAIVGRNYESDASLRARQVVSTARPSRAVLEGLAGDIKELPNIGRCAFYENPTGAYTERGEPPHSITVIAESGDAMDIARIILNRKTPGCTTYGDVGMTISSDYGLSDVINFFRPDLKGVKVKIELHPLTGFSEALIDQIRDNITAYLNSLRIGETVVVSTLYAPILSAMRSLETPSFAIRSLTAGFLTTGEMVTTELPMDFIELAYINSSLIEIEVK